MESRNLPTTRNLPIQIARLLHRIEQWRHSRPHRGPMPEELWALAAKVARQHGIARVARYGRLDYYSLKERLDAQTGQEIHGSAREPAFVELAPLLSGSMTDCTIELEHPKGAQMRIHLKSNTAPDLTALAGWFWSAAS